MRTPSATTEAQAALAAVRDTRTETRPLSLQAQVRSPAVTPVGTQQSPAPAAPNGAAERRARLPHAPHTAWSGRSHQHSARPSPQLQCPMYVYLRRPPRPSQRQQQSQRSATRGESPPPRRRAGPTKPRSHSAHSRTRPNLTPAAPNGPARHSLFPPKFNTRRGRGRGTRQIADTHRLSARVRGALTTRQRDTTLYAADAHILGPSNIQRYENRVDNRV